MSAQPDLQLMNYRGETLSIYLSRSASFDNSPESAGAVRIEKDADTVITDFDRQLVTSAFSAIWENSVNYSGFPYYDQDWQAYRPECSNAGWGNNLACGLAATDFDQDERADIYKWLLMDSIGMGMQPHLRRTRVVEESDGTKLRVLQPMLSHFATMAKLLRTLGVNDVYFGKPRRITELLVVIRAANLTDQLKSELKGVPSAVVDDIMNALPEPYIRGNEAKVAMENEVVFILNKHYRLWAFEQLYHEYRSKQNPLFDPAIQDGIDAARAAIISKEREVLSRLVSAFWGSLGSLSEKVTYLLGVMDGAHQTAITTFLTQKGVTENLAVAEVDAAYSAISGAIATWQVYSGFSDDFRKAFLLANLISFVNDSRSVCTPLKSYTFNSGDSPLSAALVSADMPNVMKDLGAQYETEYYSTILGIVDSRWKDAAESLVLDSISFVKAALDSHGQALKLYPLFFMGTATKIGAATGTWLSTLGNSDEIDWARGAYDLDVKAMWKALETRDAWAKKVWGDNVNVMPILAVLLNGTDVVSLTSKIQSLSMGGNHAAFITEDGTLYSWGEGGQIGDGNNSDRWLPAQVGTAGQWKTVSCNDIHTIAIKKDGTLWGWGLNFDSCLGDGTTQWKLSPFNISSDTDWVYATAGLHCSFGIRQDGSLWAWGDNLNGKLGDGTTTIRRTPTRIGTDSDWEIVLSKSNLTIGLKKDGTIWVWGYNGYSSGMGDGTEAPKKVPTRLGTANDWADMAQGWESHYLVKRNGELWAWGDNSSYQLGIGKSSYEKTLIRIGTDSDWASISAGDDYAFGFKTDGTLWWWGKNELNSVASKLPVQLPNTFGLTILSTALTNTIGATKNESMYARGYNYHGQLGDGTNVDRADFVGVNFSGQ